MGTHGIDVCLCGNVIVQCRCPGPHERRVVRQLCDACRARQEVPHAVAPESAPLRAEGPGGAKTASARERALLAVNNQCLLGYEPPSAEEVLDAIEAAGLRVVDANEHDADRRDAEHQRAASLVRGLPLPLDIERVLIAARRVIDRPAGECAVALFQTLREALDAVAPHKVHRPEVR